MSAAVSLGSPIGYPSDHAAMGSHFFLKTSGEINEFMASPKGIVDLGIGIGDI